MTRKELIASIQRKRSFLCVGLDTDLKKVPAHLLQEEDPVFAFNKAIIDATAPYCVAYKPNLAFYESMGVKGWIAFEKTVAYLRENYPDQFIIADAKRGDIGNTSAMYARTVCEEMDLDAVTVAPYMGEDSVTPFLGYDGKWVVLLALTSNKGSHDFQLTRDENGVRLFEQVLKSLPYHIVDEDEVGYRCYCSRERVADAILGVGADELESMINEGKPVEVSCQFCDTVYSFAPDELRKLLDDAKKA